MNREIKFRAWDKEKKCWEYWNNDMYLSFGGDLYQHGCDECGEPSNELYEIVQYTGLKDKNGKEIYDGDIVVKAGYIWFDNGVPNYRGSVEWIYSQWQVVAHCINPNKRGISDGINEGLNDTGFEEGSFSDWEVIGNIFETPELLESKDSNL